MYCPIHSCVDSRTLHSSCFFPSLAMFILYLFYFHCKPWWRSKVTKVSWRRQRCTAVWIQTSLHLCYSELVLSCLFYSFLSLSPPLFKPRHAKTEFAVIPVLVGVFMLLILICSHLLLSSSFLVVVKGVSFDFYFTFPYFC